MIKRDRSGKILDPAVQSKKGVSANMNQAEIDHITPKAKGGSNSNSNARVLSKEENLKKEVTDMVEESLTKAVFTTVYVIENNSPIIYVYHDMDGDWQFFGPEENVETDKARIVSLGEIIEMDASVKEVLDMPKGTDAHRKSRESEWVKISRN